MSDTSRRKQRRANLMQEDPHCVWCGCEVVYWEDNAGLTLPPNFATIDHLYSRLTPGGRPIKGETVLACLTCNQERCYRELARLPISELWERSGRSPHALANR